MTRMLSTKKKETTTAKTIQPVRFGGCGGAVRVGGKLFMRLKCRSRAGVASGKWFGEVRRFYRRVGLTAGEAMVEGTNMSQMSG